MLRLYFYKDVFARSVYLAISDPDRLELDPRSTLNPDASIDTMKSVVPNKSGLIRPFCQGTIQIIHGIAYNVLASQINQM
jgi:hypothetical protein